MRETDCCCLKEPRLVPVTNDFPQWWRVVPKLASGMVATDLDQLGWREIT